MAEQDRGETVDDFLLARQIADNEERLADLRKAVTAACRDVDRYRPLSNRQIEMTAEQIETLAAEIEALAARLQELAAKLRTEPPEPRLPLTQEEQ